MDHFKSYLCQVGPTSRTDIPVCPFFSRLRLDMKKGQAGMPVLQRHRPTRVYCRPGGARKPESSSLNYRRKRRLSSPWRTVEGHVI